jgi:NMD protein affecting ribosome stability and mRNA decay
MSYAIGGCVLCGSETEPRVMALIEWTEPISRERWSHVPRCVNRAGCRERVESVIGEPWPVLDRTPAPPEVRPVPPEEPSPPVAAEEAELPWLR